MLAIIYLGDLTNYEAAITHNEIIANAVVYFIV